jgi:hypothetical protein
MLTKVSARKPPRPTVREHEFCQTWEEAANLTGNVNDKKAETTKSYDTIKLGIDAHAKWYCGALRKIYPRMKTGQGCLLSRAGLRHLHLAIYAQL